MDLVIGFTVGRFAVALPMAEPCKLCFMHNIAAKNRMTAQSIKKGPLMGPSFYLVAGVGFTLSRFAPTVASALLRPNRFVHSQAHSI